MAGGKGGARNWKGEERERVIDQLLSSSDLAREELRRPVSLGLQLLPLLGSIRQLVALYTHAKKRSSPPTRPSFSHRTSKGDEEERQDRAWRNHRAPTSVVKGEEKEPRSHNDDKRSAMYRSKSLLNWVSLSLSLGRRVKDMQQATSTTMGGWKKKEWRALVRYDSKSFSSSHQQWYRPWPKLFLALNGQASLSLRYPLLLLLVITIMSSSLSRPTRIRHWKDPIYFLLVLAYYIKERNLERRRRIGSDWYWGDKKRRKRGKATNTKNRWPISSFLALGLAILIKSRHGHHLLPSLCSAFASLAYFFYREREKESIYPFALFGWAPETYCTRSRQRRRPRLASKKKKKKK